jgi:hypothetical protein
MTTSKRINDLAKRAFGGIAIVKGEDSPRSYDMQTQHKSGEYMVRLSVKVNRLATFHDKHQANAIMRAALMGVEQFYKWPTKEGGE